MRRTFTIAALVAGALLGVPAAALASQVDDRQEYVSGYDGPGEVLMRSTNPGGNCATRRALLVTNNLLVPERQHRTGKAGQGWVCVTQAGYDGNPVASWWDNGTGVRRAIN